MQAPMRQQYSRPMAQQNSAPMAQQYSAPIVQPQSSEWSFMNPFGSSSTSPQRKPACGWTGTTNCFKNDGIWLDANGRQQNYPPSGEEYVGGKHMSKTRRQKMIGGTAVPYSPSVWGSTSPYPGAVGGGMVEPNTPAGLAHYAAPVKQSAGSRRTRRQQQKRQRKQKRSQKRSRK